MDGETANGNICYQDFKEKVCYQIFSSVIKYLIMNNIILEDLNAV